MTSQLSSALRAAAEGIHPDEAAAGLIVSHGTFLHREDFIRHIETTACRLRSAPIVRAAGRMPASGGVRYRNCLNAY